MENIRFQSLSTISNETPRSIKFVLCMSVVNLCLNFIIFIIVIVLLSKVGSNHSLSLN